MASVPELMVRLVTAKAAPRVVVPPLMMRVLKLVKVVAGKVLFPVNSTVPDPGIQKLVGIAVAKAPTVNFPPLVISIDPNRLLPAEVAQTVHVLETINTVPKLNLRVAVPTFVPT